MKLFALITMIGSGPGRLLSPGPRASVLDAIRDGPYEAQFRETLRTKHGVYDADARLLREEITGDEPVGFVDLPAGTTVHPTRESLGYAVALLDAGERADRALAVLDRVLSLQDDRLSHSD